MIKKGANGSWNVDIQPGGRGSKRLRKNFPTRREAASWEHWARTQANQHEAWQPEKKDLRKLSQLATVWYESHGQELRSGRDTYKRILAAIEVMGDPIATKFNAQQFAEYRASRIEAGITPNTANREHSYLKAMFNELKRLGYWKKENPLKDLRQHRIQETEMAFLTKGEIEKLFIELHASSNPHVGLIAKICLSTGARWSEAESLTLRQVKNGLIQYARTKSGKIRSIPISEQLENEINNHAKIHERKLRVFDYSVGAFKKAIERAEIELPPGQMTHVCRHSFASWFMINGGDILTLQKILGHASLTMTMRYAHLAPEHLETAKKLNPLAGGAQ